MVMYENRAFKDRFDVIDLDPYGSAAPFLDGAVQSVKDGGLVCVTCTDAAVLCGVAPETCHAKYGSIVGRTRFCHEAALRVMLHAVQSSASRYSRYIEPLLSLSADFYFRIFMRVHTRQKQVKLVCTKMSYLLHCGACGSFHMQPVATSCATKGDNFKFSSTQLPDTFSSTCTECGSQMRFMGPVWSDAIHDRDFLERVVMHVQEDPSKYGTSARITGTLTIMTEELSAPFYYDKSDICKNLQCSDPKAVTIK